MLDGLLKEWKEHSQSTEASAVEDLRSGRTEKNTILLNIWRSSVQEFNLE
jgi:hypothetical protein